MPPSMRKSLFPHIGKAKGVTFFHLEPIWTGSKDILLSLGTTSFKSVLISKSCFKASVNMSLPHIISLRYSLKLPEEEIFLFLLVGKDPNLVFVLILLMGFEQFSS